MKKNRGLAARDFTWSGLQELNHVSPAWNADVLALNETRM